MLLLAEKVAKVTYNATGHARRSPLSRRDHLAQGGALPFTHLPAEH
ncbi:MAG: hypothetical protein ACXWUG_25965 [Polyangiales bacterium]